MKCAVATIALVAALVCSAFASPAGKKSDRDREELVIVPLDSQLIMEDPEVGYPGGFFSFNPFANPFSGLFQSMDEMLKNLRDQMSQVLNRLPPDNVEWTELGNGKGNTTSTTKVINGHRVTINETTYSDHGDNSGSVFKVRVVDVRPTSEEDTDKSEEIETDKPTERDVEEVTKKSTEMDKGSPEIQESSNEIPHSNPEITDSSEDIESLQQHNEAISSNEIDYALPLPDIETNDVNSYPYDLSNDIRVNSMLADSGALPDPDSEPIEPYNVKTIKSYSRDTLPTELYSESYE